MQQKLIVVNTKKLLVSVLLIKFGVLAHQTNIFCLSVVLGTYSKSCFMGF